MRPQVRASSTSGVKKSVRRHQRAVGVEPPDGGVVAGLGADEQLRGGRRGEGRQDVREQAGGELAGASGAVAELGEAAGGPESIRPAAAVTGRAYVAAGGRSGRSPPDAAVPSFRDPRVRPRRRVPRTDAVLAEPQVALAVARLGRALVKEAVGAAQDRVRRGEIAPEAVVDAVLDALPDTATTLRPGAQRHRRAAAHQPRPRTALRRRAPGARRRRRHLRRRAGPGHRRPRPPRPRVRSTRCSPPFPPPAPRTWSTTAPPRSPSSPPRWPAPGAEIVIARGELVEIGDGFRIPDLLTATGARLREVGTTNRVTPGDYADAVGPDTAFVLKVHPSNFVVTGFTRSVEVQELSGLGVPVVADIGSGLLAPASPAARRAGRGHGADPRRHPRHGVGRQAARRPAGGAAARRARRRRASWSGACAGTRSPARCGWTS